MLKAVSMEKGSVNRLVKMLADTRGDGYVSVAMKILIAVVLGAAVLAVLNAAIPTLITDIVNTARTLLII